MKKKLILAIISGILGMESKAQNYWKLDATNNLGDIVWGYDFTVSEPKSIQAIGVNSESTPETEGFLPKPFSGTVAVRTYNTSNPNANPAGFLLSGSCATSSLTMIATSGPSNAPTASAATSRFAAYGFANATRVMSIHFNMALGVTPSNTNANWYFMIGGNSNPGILTNNNQNMVISNNNYDHDNRIFGAYRLIKNGNGDEPFRHTTMQKASATETDRDWNSTSAANLAANTSYKIDIYCNNSTAIQYYIHNGSEIALEAGKYVIYVDDNLKGTFDKIAITASQNLKSFMIMSRDGAQSGAGNYDNSASLTISNFKVVHLGPVSTTPVTLTDFSGNATNTGIALNWQTVNEQNNAHFILNRSINGKDFSYLTRVEGNGSSNNVKHYNYTDKNPFTGTNYYQLEQIDKDGTKTVIDKIVPVKYMVSEEVFSISKISSNQLKAFVFSEKGEDAELSITDISGKVIYKATRTLKQGSNQIDLFNSAKPGVYVATLKGTTGTKSVKFIL